MPSFAAEISDAFRVTTSSTIGVTWTRCGRASSVVPELTSINSRGAAAQSRVGPRTARAWVRRGGAQCTLMVQRTDERAILL